MEVIEMATHTLTPTQMWKFLEANGVPAEPQVEGDEFTTEKLLEIAASRGDLAPPPSHTDDPLVNYAVDCVRKLDWFGDEPDYEDGPYDADLYAKEIVAFATLR